MTTALLVIDLQRFADETFWDVPAVVGRVRRLVDEARGAGVPVAWVQHDDPWLERGSDAWQLHDGLEPAPDEMHVYKQIRDVFAGTDIDSALRERGIDHLVIAGAQSDYCIRTAAQSAAARGYDVTLVGDGHTTCDVEFGGLPSISAEQMVAQTNQNLADIEYPDVTVEVRPATDIAFVAA